MTVEGGKTFDLDLLIQQIGPFGKFQLINYLLICIPIALTAMYTLTFVFTAGDLEYRCRIPGCDSDNTNLQAPFRDFTIPKDGDKFSMCQKFHHVPNATIEDQCQADLFDRTRLEDCSEFVYQDDETTILSEWDLGCSEEWKLSLVGTINNIGQFVCLPLTGYFSDRFGRRTAFILGNLFAAAFGLIRSFSTNYIMFIIFEFLEPALSAGVYSAGFILGMELVGPERRVLGAFFINVFYALGEALLGLLAMLTRDWRLLMRVAYVPTFIFLIYRWLIPESARWLLNMNRTRDAAKIIDSAAKMNKSPLTPEARKMLDNVLNAEPVVEEKDGKLREKEPEAKEYNLLLAFKSKTLVLRMINCSYCWIAVCFVFYGMSMNSVSVAGDKYVNFIMNCLIEIPGAGLCCLLMDRIGRRMMLCISLILSGAACIGFIFLTGDVPEAVHITVFLIGKFNISMSFITIYVYTAELFPTELRHSLLAACSMFGRLGSIVAPFTPLLGKYVEPLPMILFATMAISSGIFIMFAPETLNKTLPDTLKEAEDIGK
ncbi:organic cation transporter protein-like [Phlebotomus papatasi]|uniref:organic cation transporter protein-like n=1 Tax=Phlebotomus papatasi TaxID=29031 RepID=UPI002483CC62|nr:organic cation transporter protein-like [Phlebotomus papatasi]